MATLNVLTVPAFDDNYLWLVHDGQYAIAIDPGDADAILAALHQHHLTLVGILLTHHHADHIGGVAQLLQHSPVPVAGPRGENIAGVTLSLGQGDQVTIPELHFTLQVLDVPGHTRGHIAYTNKEQAWLFCGDTLFAGGCGRLFEGTPAQMVASLDQLAALPPSTKVYCAHEYTLSNLKFAIEVEPDNLALQARIITEQDKRARNIPTVPSTIAIEQATNPFLRFREPAIAKRLSVLGKLTQTAPSPVDIFATLREWKNAYR